MPGQRRIRDGDPALTPEQNERVCRVGSATPMGNALREYWLPALLSEGVAADSEPLRVKLHGERPDRVLRLVRTVGLLGNHCPHRCASLFFARNEHAA
jgi:hypothetical protein